MMQHDLIDSLVNAVLLRMRQRVLVLLTAADGYKEIILARLQRCQTLSLNILFTDAARQFHSQEEWSRAGAIITSSEIEQTGALDNIEKVFIPFLDFSTAAEIASGLLSSDCTRLLHLAHISNKAILALDYNCNPASELNQLKGLSRCNDPLLAADYLPGLAARGVQLCTLDQMLSATDTSTPAPAPAPAYMTLSELKRRNGQAPPGVRLTDLALEYYRSKNTG